MDDIKKNYLDISREYSPLMEREETDYDSTLSISPEAKSASSDGYNNSVESSLRDQENTSKLVNSEEISITNSIHSSSYKPQSTGFSINAKSGLGSFSRIHTTAPSSEPTSSGLFFRVITMTGVGESDTKGSIFWGKGTTNPDGLLAGNAGDLCLSEGGKVYTCVSGVIWFELGKGEQQWLFGDGSDGNVTISSPTTMTRNMYYDTLTLESTLRPNGFVIYANNIIVNAGGSINVDGGNGGAGGNARAIAGSTARYGDFTNGSPTVIRNGSYDFSSLWPGQVISNGYGSWTILRIDSANQLTLTTNATMTVSNVACSVTPVALVGSGGSAGTAGNPTNILPAVASGKSGTVGSLSSSPIPGTDGSNGTYSAIISGSTGSGGKSKNGYPSYYSLGGAAGVLYTIYLNPLTSLELNKFVSLANTGGSGSGAGGSLWTTGGGSVDVGAGGGGGGSGGNGGNCVIFARTITLNSTGDWISAKGGNGGNGGIGQLGFIYNGITGVSGGGGGGGGVGGTVVITYGLITGSMTINVSKGLKGNGGSAAGGLSESGFAGTDGADGRYIQVKV